VSRPRGRGPYRKPLLVRVRETLTTNPSVWLGGFAVGVVVLVMTSLVGLALGLLLAVPLTLVAAAILDLKGRVMILRRRILVTRQSASRRQFLALTVSILGVAGLTGVLGWMLRNFILGGYDEQVQRYMTRRPKKK